MSGVTVLQKKTQSAREGLANPPPPARERSPQNWFSPAALRRHFCVWQEYGPYPSRSAAAPKPKPKPGAAPSSPNSTPTSPFRPNSGPNFGPNSSPCPGPNSSPSPGPNSSLSPGPNSSPASGLRSAAAAQKSFVRKSEEKILKIKTENVEVIPPSQVLRGREQTLGCSWHMWAPQTSRQSVPGAHSGRCVGWVGCKVKVLQFCIRTGSACSAKCWSAFDAFFCQLPVALDHTGWSGLLHQRSAIFFQGNKLRSCFAVVCTSLQSLVRSQVLLIVHRNALVQQASCLAIFLRSFFLTGNAPDKRPSKQATMDQ